MIENITYIYLYMSEMLNCAMLRVEIMLHDVNKNQKQSGLHIVTDIVLISSSIDIVHIRDNNLLFTL